MSNADPQPYSRVQFPVSMIAFALMCAIELALVSFVYGLRFTFVCRNDLPAVLCQLLSDAVPITLALTGLICILIVVRRDVLQDLKAALRPAPAVLPLLVHLVGSAIVFLPWSMQQLGFSIPSPAVLLLIWSVGLFLSGAGFLLTMFRPAGLGNFVSKHAASLSLCLFVAIIGPSITRSLQGLWAINVITDTTFKTVLLILSLLGETAQSDIQQHLIEVDNFWVKVGRQCSGVEGFGLITGFLTFYLWLFRKELIMSRAILILPIGIFLSWVFNALRIAVLIQIGNHISPNLALDGFHSHAGWLIFMALALVLALSAHQIQWFQREPNSKSRERSGTQTAFFDDPVVAYILPFAVFMASATLASAVTTVPALLYPLRMLMVVAVLWAVRGVLSKISWRPDSLALAAGFACGVLWLLTAPSASATDSLLAERLSALPAFLLLGWVVIRVVGTAVVVPLVEELFFRGYLLSRPAFSGRYGTLIALAFSSLAFGFLHDRFVAGLLAGVLFGVLYLRHQKVSDAVWAHMVANATIAAAAVASGDWSLI